MMARPVHRFPFVRLVCVVALGAALSGCKDEMCPAKPPPEPWKPHMSLIPGETVVCGNNRGPQDNYPPTQLFVYFKGRNAAEAFDETKKKFEAAGWTMSDFRAYGEGSSKSWDGTFTKGGQKIEVGINKNDFGIQGSFKLDAKK